MQPLRREWVDVRAKCETLVPKILEESLKAAKAGKSGLNKRKASKPRAAFDRLLTEFVHRLAHIRILDPACGSGNFLFVAVQLLLDLEKEVVTYGAAYGVTQLPQVRPTQLLGIEINPFAQELAQVVIWIGYLQWMYHNGFHPPRDPVLDPMVTIENRDAILDLSNPAHPKEPEWPEADFIIGNPPFLGDKKMRRELGDHYVTTLRSLYANRLPGQSDLCCYWFEKGRQQIERGRCSRAGLLATQGIRGGANRVVLKKIKETGAKLPFVNDVIAMYYCLLDEKTSLSAKASIVFALLYFITPIDVIPDFILALGYTDDATVIASTILLLKSQLKTEHYEKAKASLEKE